MALIWSILLQAAAFMLAAYLLLVAWAVYYHFSTTEVPSGVCQPLKVRFLHISVVMVFGLVSCLNEVSLWKAWLLKSRGRSTMVACPYLKTCVDDNCLLLGKLSTQPQFPCF